MYLKIIQKSEVNNVFTIQSYMNQEYKHTWFVKNKFNQHSHLPTQINQIISYQQNMGDPVYRDSILQYLKLTKDEYNKLNIQRGE